jgi:uncharacterized protein
MWSHGTFYWNELMTRDAEQAKRFYADSLGWTFDEMPMEGMTYFVAKSGDKTVGGIFQLGGSEHADVSETWMGYIAVDDIDARLDKAVAAGAQVIRPVFEVPDIGRIAILHEPGGAVIGWITPPS